VKFITLFHGHSLLIAAKPVSWTLDPDRPRITGSRYNDTLSCFGKPMSQKITVLFRCLLGDFWQKLHWGYIYPPLPGQGLIQAVIRIIYTLYYIHNYTLNNLLAGRTNRVLICNKSLQNPKLKVRLKIATILPVCADVRRTPLTGNSYNIHENNEINLFWA